MMQETGLRQDFRFKGFPNHSMHSPRQPVTAPLTQDKREAEEKFIKVFGKSSVFDPAHHEYWKPKEAHHEYWKPREAKPRIDEGHVGLQYGTNQINNSPRVRGFHDPFNERSSAEMRKTQQMRVEAMDDIRKFKQEKMMQNFHREEENKRDSEIQEKYYPWDRLKDGHGAPKGDNRRRKFLEVELSPRDPVTYTREPQKPPTYTKHRGHDLFLDTLGGPGGTVVRQDGEPSLKSMPDPRLHRSTGPSFERQADLSEQEFRIKEQKQKIDDLKKELDFLKSPRGQEALRDAGRSNGDKNGLTDSRYEPSFGRRSSPSWRQNNDFDSPLRDERRSLDLEATRGGAGAPMRDDRGKAITRLPVTMERTDYGSQGAKIQEHIPGKKYNLPQEPIYDPFGRPGGGAPVKDRYGNRNTLTYGNFERKAEPAEMTKRVRAKEVMLNDLRVGIEEQQKNKEEMARYQRAPYGELAELIRSKEVGQPKRDPITGTLANQHLPNSDVSRLKMNYQPIDNTEKRRLHEFLTEQVEEGARSRHLEKLREKQESNKHFDQFDQRWGAFGGGAPKDRVIRKKVNLDNALYHYDRETRSEESHRYRKQADPPLYDGPSAASNGQHQSPAYQKRYFEEDIRHRSPDVTPRFVKNTTHSNSTNQYEYPMDKSPRPMLKGGAPYATGSEHAF